MFHWVGLSTYFKNERKGNAETNYSPLVHFSHHSPWLIPFLWTGIVQSLQPHTSKNKKVIFDNNRKEMRLLDWDLNKFNIIETTL